MSDQPAAIAPPDAPATPPVPPALPPGVLPLPPRGPSVFERRWPVVADTASPAALAVTLVTAAVAAIAVPLDRVGVGWLVAAVTGFAGLALLGRGQPRPRHLWAVAAVALFAVGTVRAAGWLFVLCVLAAAGCFTLATVGARTFPGLLLSCVFGPVSSFRAIPWAARGGYRAGNQRYVQMFRLGVSVAVGLVLLVVFGALFASADPAFAKLVQKFSVNIRLDHPVQTVFVFVVFGFGTLGAAYLLANPTTIGDVKAGPPKPVRRLEWALPVGLLVALFAAFVAVQATAWFGDREYVLRTIGLTFAEYARRGFWQLLLVTLLTLLVMAIAVRKAPRADAMDRLVLRVLLGALAAGALAVVASALWRMSVYEQAYGFTRLRVLVSAFELALGVMFVLIIAAGVRLEFGWLPNAIVAVGVLTLLGLAVLDPDRFIAAQNITRYQQTNRIDVEYLATLSADAAPELDRLPSTMRYCALSQLAIDLGEVPSGWQSYNVSQARAARIVENLPLDVPCGG
jgi:Domain of unknown function (DUF4173)